MASPQQAYLHASQGVTANLPNLNYLLRRRLVSRHLLPLIMFSRPKEANSPPKWTLSGVAIIYGLGRMERSSKREERVDTVRVDTQIISPVPEWII